MNDQLQSRLVEIIDAITTAVTAAKDFTMAELPDVVASFMAFSRAWETFLWLALVAVCVGAAWVAIKHGYASKKVGPYGMTADSRIAAATFGTGIAGGMGIAAIVQTKQMLMVWFAPKVYLLIHLAQLIK